MGGMSNRHLENAGRQGANRPPQLRRIKGRRHRARRHRAGRNPSACRPCTLARNRAQMEQRGTERGDQGRDIAQRNAQIINLAEVRQRIEQRGQPMSETTDMDEIERLIGRRRRYPSRWRAARRVAGKSDIGRPGNEPAGLLARGRLRELGVVRFPRTR